MFETKATKIVTHLVNKNDDILKIEDSNDRLIYCCAQLTISSMDDETKLMCNKKIDDYPLEIKKLLFDNSHIDHSFIPNFLEKVFEVFKIELKKECDIILKKKNKFGKWTR